MVRPKQVNFITEEMLKKALPGKIKTGARPVKAFLIVFVAIALYFGVGQISKIVDLNLKVAQAKRKMQEVKTRLNQLRSQSLELEKQRNEMAKDEQLRRERLEFLLSTSSQETNYSNLLTLVTTFVPQDLWITYFDITKSKIEISGTATNPQLITQFMNQLNSSGIFSNSNFTSSEKLQLEDQPVHNFKITTEPVWEVLSKNRSEDKGEIDKDLPLTNN